MANTMAKSHHSSSEFRSIVKATCAAFFRERERSDLSIVSVNNARIRRGCRQSTSSRATRSVAHPTWGFGSIMRDPTWWRRSRARNLTPVPISIRFPNRQGAARSGSHAPVGTHSFHGGVRSTDKLASRPTGVSEPSFGSHRRRSPGVRVNDNLCPRSPQCRRWRWKGVRIDQA